MLHGDIALAQVAHRGWGESPQCSKASEHGPGHPALGGPDWTEVEPKDLDLQRSLQHQLVCDSVKKKKSYSKFIGSDKEAQGRDSKARSSQLKL